LQKIKYLKNLFFRLTDLNTPQTPFQRKVEIFHNKYIFPHLEFLEKYGYEARQKQIIYKTRQKFELQKVELKAKQYQASKNYLIIAEQQELQKKS